MKTSQNIKITILILLVGTALIGCGPQKIVGSAADSASLAETSPTATSSQPVSSCSHDVANISDLAVRMETYIDPVYGESASQVRVKFDRFPSTFTASNAAIEIWVRAVDANGNNLPMQQVSFQLQTQSGNSFSSFLNGSYQSVAWTDLQSGGATNAQTLFQNLTFLVDLGSMASTASVMTVALYENGIANGADRYIEILIPRFYANPGDYAQAHPQSLVQLHPLNYMGTSQSPTAYSTAANALCITSH